MTERTVLHPIADRRLDSLSSGGVHRLQDVRGEVRRAGEGERRLAEQRGLLERQADVSAIGRIPAVVVAGSPGVLLWYGRPRAFRVSHL